ncbi:hypothetical protein HDU97_004539 [Phlyctochytrium planicorne]|nr:hypothetical protein HDU97_004539 [Phlyctochytrium planicorne]
MPIQETTPLLGGPPPAASNASSASHFHNRSDSDSTLLPTDSASPISISFLPLVKRPSPWIVIPVGILHLFCFALCLLPLQGFFIQRACIELGISESGGSDVGLLPKNCQESEAASKLAVKWMTIYGLCGSLPSIFVTPLTGTFVDFFGRRPMMIASISVFIVSIGTLIGAGLGLPFWIIFIGNFLFGLFGNYQTVTLCMQSYLSDTVTDTNRAQFFSLSEALLSAAAMLAPFSGGVAAAYLGPLGSFYIALSLESVVLLYTILVVPESLKVRKRNPLSELSESDYSPSPKNNLARLLKVTLSFAWVSLVTSFKTLAGRSKTILALFLFCGECIQAGINNFLLVFFAFRFQWSPIEIGQYLLVASTYRVFYLACVLPCLVYLFIRYRAKPSGADPGISRERFAFDMGMIRFAWMLMGFGYAATGLVPKGWMMYFVAFGYGFGYTAYPNAQSILSRCIPADQQGRLFAAINMNAALAGSIGLPIFGFLYTVRPQAMLWGMSSLVVVILVTMFFVKSDELQGYANNAGNGSEEVVVE